MSWGLLVGTILISVSLGREALEYIRGKEWEFNSFTDSVFELSWSIGAIFMAGGIIAMITLAVQKEKWKRRLSFLAPVGRMGLTNYTLQAIAFSLLFPRYLWSLKLWDNKNIGGFYGLLIALPVCAFIYFFSRWWLKHFKYGPFEWLWRSLTYLKFQPMKLRPSNENEKTDGMNL